MKMIKEEVKLYYEREKRLRSLKIKNLVNLISNLKSFHVTMVKTLNSHRLQSLLISHRNMQIILAITKVPTQRSLSRKSFLVEGSIMNIYKSISEESLLCLNLLGIGSD